MKIQNIETNNYKKQNFGQVNLVYLKNSALRATTPKGIAIEINNASNKAAGEINGWVSSLTTLVGLGKQTNKTCVIASEEVVESFLDRLTVRGIQFQKELGDLLVEGSENTPFILLTKEHKDEILKVFSLKGIWKSIKEAAESNNTNHCLRNHLPRKLAETVKGNDTVHVYSVRDLDSLASIYRDMDI